MAFGLGCVALGSGHFIYNLIRDEDSVSEKKFDLSGTQSNIFAVSMIFIGVLLLYLELSE